MKFFVTDYYTNHTLLFIYTSERFADSLNKSLFRGNSCSRFLKRNSCYSFQLFVFELGLDDLYCLQQVWSYGDQDPQLRITKTGNAYLRQLLVNAAHYVLELFGPDSDLRRWGLKLAERGGKPVLVYRPENAKKRVVVGVARKLAVLLHHLWKTGEVYDPFYLSRKHGQLSEAIPAAA